MVRVTVHYTPQASLADACWRLAAGRPIVRDASGKPRLQHSAAGIGWAHSHGAGLAALAEDAEIGVDLEVLRPQPDALAIARAQFAPAELDWLLARPEAGRSIDFLRLWTLKEAYLKATGEGLSRPLESFTVLPGDGAEARLAAVDGDRRIGQDWTLRTLEAPAGLVAAAAVRWGCGGTSFILMT